MNKVQLEHMDDHMLLSIINEKLRLECESLEALLVLYELDSGHVNARMARIGYHYDAGSNQFKAA
ncbi:hypothetical protein AN401_09870 [Zobellella denitrificans]|uniref:DUF4250 domain-containing protein n=1 Tax=Zobellella denitrificans TaxID=347534 RepID=A0A291HPW0_9GAMM|nr:DUF4250 domain-containing protein [Zobellella denitrificans]ATG74118.1 hypothetical protein AN401_09870 [Zobellella denitrificans]